MTAPYFINPVIDRLATSSPEERPMLVRRIAACIGDEATLRKILGLDPEEFARFYPDMIPLDLSTDDTIESFLSHYSKAAPAKPATSQPVPASEPVAEQKQESIQTSDTPAIPVAPAIDYAALLDDETPDSLPADQTSDMIANFLSAVPPKTPSQRKNADRAKQTDSKPSAAQSTANKPSAAHSPATQSPATKPSAPQPSAPQQNNDKTGQDSDSTQLSEELFKIMVKNKNYSKALEIITELCLNNPKKSVYFADQMRFLQKLVQLGR